MAHNLKFNKKLKRKLEKDYGKLEYPHYDNYDAIEVPFVEAIPSDYDGVMGVPITFLDKYNPKQFEIIGYSREIATPISKIVKPNDVYQQGGNAFYIRVGEHDLRRLYGRIVIRRRKEGNNQ